MKTSSPAKQGHEHSKGSRVHSEERAPRRVLTGLVKRFHPGAAVGNAQDCGFLSQAIEELMV
ncbi:MAG: hypothetical protein HYV35_05855 [Lentisphaerae bacterium]|nr:hypothetical protein [Lentisphaerota bacterium]